MRRRNPKAHSLARTRYRNRQIPMKRDNKRDKQEIKEARNEASNCYSEPACPIKTGQYDE